MKILVCDSLFMKMLCFGHVFRVLHRDFEELDVKIAANIFSGSVPLKVTLIYCSVVRQINLFFNCINMCNYVDFFI